jgi:hypothetical protein
MLFRCLTATLALATLATVSEAGPRRRAQVVYPPAAPTVYPSLPPGSVVGVPGGGSGVATVLVGAAGLEYVSHFTPAASPPPPAGIVAPDGASGDGLDEVNAQRVARGLRPFIRDEGLTQAAFACAAFRAANGLFGHTSNDFGFVPAGSWASAAGCAAYPASYGWMSCCVYDNYTYAGAAWVTGRDGKRYMHLFVR